MKVPLSFLICFGLSACGGSLSTPTTTKAPAVTPTVPVPVSVPIVATLPQRINLLAEYLLLEGTGTVATDTSGKGNNGTISGPTWDSTQDLSFTVNGSFVQFPTAVNQLNTFQVAMYAPYLDSLGLPSIFGDGTGQPFNASILCGTDAGETCIIASNALGRSHHFVGFNSSTTSALEPLSSGWHIVTIVAGLGTDKDHIYYDGAEINGYVPQNSGYFLHPATGNYQLGGSAQYSQTWFRGKIAAAWAWSTALSPNDVSVAYQAALNFVLQKGVVINSLPVYHSTPLILGGLDSRTYGLFLSSTNNSWISTLTLTDPSYTTLNLGIKAVYVYDEVPTFDLTYGRYANPGSADTIEIFWGGINDFDTGSFTARGVANALRGLVLKAKAQGARVIVATETSSTGADVFKSQLNAIIRNEAYAWGADNIADLGTIPQLGADNAYSSVVYFGDGFHPTDAGEVYVRAVMSNVVNELIGSTLTNRHVTGAASYTAVAGDRFLDLNGAGAQTITLPDCIGYSLPREILNRGTNPATLATTNAEVLTGSTTIAVNLRAVLIPVPGSAATAGCSWERLQ